MDTFACTVFKKSELVARISKKGELNKKSQRWLFLKHRTIQHGNDLSSLRGGPDAAVTCSVPRTSEYMTLAWSSVSKCHLLGYHLYAVAIGTYYLPYYSLSILGS